MIVYAIYIITLDGRPLLSEVFQAPDNLPHEGLLSGLLASIQAFSTELLNEDGAIDHFRLKSVTYHLKNFGQFQIALATSNDDEPSKIINKIGWNFLQNYGERIDEWMGDMDAFNNFKQKILSMISPYSSIDKSKSIDPTRKLNTVNLFKLTKDLKQTALAIVTIQSGTVEQIASESGEDLEIVTRNIEKLKEHGYVGLKEQDGKLIYFF